MAVEVDFNVACPVEGRRTPRELCAKLFIVNFGVLYAYVHLLHKRREPYIAWRVLICFFWPVTALWQMIVPVLGIVVEAVLRGFDKDRLEQALAITLGSYPESDERFTEQGLEVVGRPESVTGDVVSGAVLVTQSITSIWLYHRRQVRDAVMLYDKRILHLALTGIGVGVLLLSRVLRPPDHPRHKSHWLAIFRPPRSSDGGSDTHFLLIDLFTSATLTAILSWAGRGMNMLTISMVWEYAYTKVGGGDGRLIVTFLRVIATGGCIIFCHLLYLEYSINGLKAAVRFLLLAAATAIAVLGMVTLVFGVGMNLVMTGWLDYVFLFASDEGLSKISKLTSDQPRPAAWSDPVANWVVWLA